MKMSRSVILIVVSLLVIVGLLSFAIRSQFDLRPWNERKARLVELTEVGNKLVIAISQFQKEEGRLPKSLSELVPQYLAELPDDNVNGLKHQGFVYSLAKVDSDFDGYRLSVLTPRFFMNFDELFYYPSEQYPEMIHNQEVETISSWAYLHE